MVFHRQQILKSPLYGGYTRALTFQDVCQEDRDAWAFLIRWHVVRELHMVCLVPPSLSLPPFLPLPPPPSLPPSLFCAPPPLFSSLTAPLSLHASCAPPPASLGLSPQLCVCLLHAAVDSGNKSVEGNGGDEDVKDRGMEGMLAGESPSHEAGHLAHTHVCLKNHPCFFYQKW